MRLHAIEWHIDPRKVGVLGFSAGGHLVAAITNQYHERSYRVVDAADKESLRPDFAVALYPGHLWIPGGARLAFNPDIHVTRNTPPTFLLQAETDSVDNVNQSLAYYTALKDAGVPVELHLYADGGHAFGLRRTRDPITEWPQLVEKWLRTIRDADAMSHDTTCTSDFDAIAMFAAVGRARPRSPALPPPNGGAYASELVELAQPHPPIRTCSTRLRPSCCRAPSSFHRTAFAAA